MAVGKDKLKTVKQMILDAKRTTRMRRAGKGFDDSSQGGPFFTFLVGAGFSLTAGIPGINHLAAAFKEYERSTDADEKIPLRNIFESTRNNQDVAGSEYYELMANAGSAAGRQAFITAAIQWAAKNHAQVNPESMLLASLLSANDDDLIQIRNRRTGKPLSKEDGWLFRNFA